MRAWLPRWRPSACVFTAACGSRHPEGADADGHARRLRRRLRRSSRRPRPSIPIAALIATSQQHFEAGERELKVGHLERARSEFDRAVDVLLESPYGARTEPRLREHFDRLVDRISAYEVTALAQGDGFAEKKYEPASIDELLEDRDASRSRRPAPTTAAAVKADLAADRARHPDPAERARALATSSCSRAGCATSSRTA